RRREAAGGANREVDLANQENHHDADRDQADGGDLQKQVGEVGGREETFVLQVEDDPDQGDREDHPQRGGVPLQEAPQQVARRGGLGSGGLRGGDVRGADPPGCLCCSAVSVIAPVIAPTTCSSLVCEASKTPALRPSRRTKMRSATANTSTR